MLSLLFSLLLACVELMGIKVAGRKETNKLYDKALE